MRLWCGGWRRRESTPDWKSVSGMLVNDGTNGATAADISSILAPCQLSTQNYAVEATILYVRKASGFGILARGTGYTGFIGTTDTYIGAAAILKDRSDVLGTRAYYIDTAWHTYRLEVKGAKLLFFVDAQKWWRQQMPPISLLVVQVLW
jgi:hypothetical protein